jgi:hypothetical protein
MRDLLTSPLPDDFRYTVGADGTATEGGWFGWGVDPPDDSSDGSLGYKPLVVQLYRSRSTDWWPKRRWKGEEVFIVVLMAVGTLLP